MTRMIVGLFIGMILSSVLFMGSLSLIPMILQSGNPSLLKTRADNAETYHGIITSSLQEAGDEIQDSDINQFYQSLLREYDLDKPSPGIAQAEHSSPAEVLPDIKKINRLAITLPLREAGRHIQDEEIAQFYYELLENSGWTIESD